MLAAASAAWWSPVADCSAIRPAEVAGINGRYSFFLNSVKRGISSSLWFTMITHQRHIIICCPYCRANRCVAEYALNGDVNRCDTIFSPTSCSIATNGATLAADAPVLAKLPAITAICMVVFQHAFRPVLRVNVVLIGQTFAARLEHPDGGSAFHYASTPRAMRRRKRRSSRIARASKRRTESPCPHKDRFRSSDRPAG